MKKFFKYLSTVFLIVAFFSSISFGANSPMSTEQAYKALRSDNGKESYIIGKFPMIHTKDRSIGNPEIVDNASDLGQFCDFYIRFELINTEKNKTYSLQLKPVTGSNQTVYYRNEKKLEENVKDSYWVLKVPAGSYELTNMICSLSVRQPGYHDFRAQVLDVPISQVIKKNINFNTQAKQIVYVGDYETMFTTYICLYQTTTIYHYRALKITLNNNFETVKDEFINGADEKTREKLNGLEFISAIE